jgi:hypothetical protein
MRWEGSERIQSIILTSACRYGDHHCLSRIRPLGLFQFRIYFSETYESIWKVGRTTWKRDQLDTRYRDILGGGMATTDSLLAEI